MYVYISSSGFVLERQLITSVGVHGSNNLTPPLAKFSNACFPTSISLQGNPATSGCCSKCWREHQKKEGATATTCAVVNTPHRVEPAKVSESDVKPDEDVPEEVVPNAEALKKKKGKKKLSYKAMMKGMMHTQSDEQKAEMEKEALLKVTGGGAFQKIEKI